MYLSDMAVLVRRRWYLLLVGMLLTAAVGVRAAHTPDRYIASEVMVVQPPISSTPNPLTGMYPSLAVTAAVVASRLNSPDARATFRSSGVTGKYSFEPRNTGTNQEPQYVIASMSITYIADDAASALRGLALLSDTFEADLKALQDLTNVGSKVRIGVAVLVPPTATLLTHSPLRSLVGAALLGAVGTAAVMLWADEIIRRRRQRVPSFGEPAPALPS